MRHYSVELQTAKQTLTAFKISFESTESDFPCHLKVDKNKLAWIIAYGSVKGRKIDDYR